MKEGIHPTFYPDAVVICGSCGTTWRTGSTKKEIHVDLCSNCHPFFTGTQRIVDTAGQVERFTKRLQAREAMTPQEGKPNKKERRARERAKRSGIAEEPPTAAAPEPTAETAAEAPAQAQPEAAAPPAPRERKPRPPRERKPRESKPAQLAAQTPVEAEVTAPIDVLPTAEAPVQTEAPSETEPDA